MHYLITGHTGFKGAWLTLWLTSLGHKVSGISLDPIPGALFETANVAELMENDLRIDIRNAKDTFNAIKSLEPDVIFHMAAQPLVRESYLNPRGTIETNVMGTLNVIEAVSSTPSIKAQVVITTDKVYRNNNKFAGYVESDPLGGDDPYSASKAMADILAQSWIKSFDSPPTAIVRAGNVIGGGDVGKDRLIPDLFQAIKKGEAPLIRYPDAVRPWQHVLDCLNGYIMVSQSLILGEKVGCLNIGPNQDSLIPVKDVVARFSSEFNMDSKWIQDKSSFPNESEVLTLDASRANNFLNWTDKLTFEETVSWTARWYREVMNGTSSLDLTLNQIKEFLELN